MSDPKSTTVESLASLHAKLNQPKPGPANGTTPPQIAPKESVGAGAPAVDVAPSPAPEPKIPKVQKTDTVAPDPLPFKILRGKDSTVPRPCLANVVAFLREHSSWVGVLAYDEFADRIVIKRSPPGWSHPSRIWSDTDDAYTACWFQQNRMMISSQLASQAADVVAKENSFHPVRDYLKRLRWDKVPRIDGWLAKYLGAEDLLVNQAFGRMWLLSAVARVFQPGTKVDHTLQLEGEQGAKKSTSLSILAGGPTPESGDEWFTDNIGDIHDKDARIDLKGKWIIEFSELDKFKGKSLETVKAFLSVRVDHFRAPYDRRTVDIPRQCVFAGTTNNYESLNDETGSRRFWPVRCHVIDLDQLKKDRDQIWAEAYLRYNQGEKWWPDGDPNLNVAIRDAQVQRYEAGADDDLIADWIDNLPEEDDPADLYLEGSESPVLSRRTKVRIREIMLFVLHTTSTGRGAGQAEQQVKRWLKHHKWERGRDRGQADRGHNYWLAPKTRAKIGASTK